MHTFLVSSCDPLEPDCQLLSCLLAFAQAVLMLGCSLHFASLVRTVPVTYVPNNVECQGQGNPCKGGGN